MSSQENIYLGIDLGTSAIKMSYVNPNTQEPETIPLSDGSTSYPVYFARNKNGQVCYGKTAKDKMKAPAFHVCYEFKRFIGKRYDSQDVKKDLEEGIGKGITDKREDGGIVILLNGKEYTPIEMYKELMKDVLKICESNQIKQRNAVVTVPVSFTDLERKLITEMFQKDLNFVDVRIMNEPTAAACSFDIEVGNYAVFDYGGGTLDISLINFYETANKEKRYEVLSHDGLSHNGGSDIDQRILNKVLDEKVVDEIEDFDKTKISRSQMQRLKVSAEQCKLELSVSPTTTFLYDDDNTFDIAREEFEDWCKNDIFDVAINKLVDVLNNHNKTRGKEYPISKILMVGGSSNIPYMQKTIHERTHLPVLVSENPLSSVSIGAARHGEHIRVNEMIFKEVSPYNVGYEAKSPSLSGKKIIEVIPKNIPLPYKNHLVNYVSVDNQKQIDIILRGNFEKWFSFTCPVLGKGIIQLNEDFKKGTPVKVFVEMDEEGKLSFSFTIESSVIKKEYTLEFELDLEK